MSLISSSRGPLKDGSHPAGGAALCSRLRSEMWERVSHLSTEGGSLLTRHKSVEQEHLQRELWGCACAQSSRSEIRCSAVRYGARPPCTDSP